MNEDVFDSPVQTESLWFFVLQPDSTDASTDATPHVIGRILP